MAYIITDRESSNLNFRGDRSSYLASSYFDNLDTDISQLLTVPDPTELRIEAANWYTIFDNDGNSKYPNTEDNPFAYLRDSYYPDGNPTNFNYAFMAGEHAVFYVRNIQPERNLFTYRWEIDGNVKSEGPSLTLYNLTPDTFEGNIVDGIIRGAFAGFGQEREVVCIATNKNGKEIRQSLSYKCDEFIGMGGTPGELTEANRNLKVNGLWQNNRRNSYINYLAYLSSSDSTLGLGGLISPLSLGGFITPTSPVSPIVPPAPPVYEFDPEIFYDESLPNSIRFRPLKETTFEDA